jgi:hypothetical protein
VRVVPRLRSGGRARRLCQRNRCTLRRMDVVSYGSTGPRLSAARPCGARQSQASEHCAPCGKFVSQGRGGALDSLTHTLTRSEARVRAPDDYELTCALRDWEHCWQAARSSCGRRRRPRELPRNCDDRRNATLSSWTADGTGRGPLMMHERPSGRPAAGALMPWATARRGPCRSWASRRVQVGEHVVRAGGKIAPRMRRLGAVRSAMPRNCARAGVHESCDADDGAK